MVNVYFNKPRHPEKIFRSAFPQKSKPDWIRVRSEYSEIRAHTHAIVRKHGLSTVCEEASCPNLADCWTKRHATFLIMGRICTRGCGFCNVTTGVPSPLDPEEPGRVAIAVQELGLSHAVITSVDRDDLDDGGAAHFAAIVKAIREVSSDVTIEILTPDFLNKPSALEVILKNPPDVFNHNIETVPRFYPKIRPGARYFHSLQLLYNIKSMAPHIFTKSGLMLGFGESRDEIIQVMDDLRSAHVDFITLGQYLQPTPRHTPVNEFITPESFNSYAQLARGKGFSMVSSSPLTRSSFHAGEDFQALRKSRQNSPNTKLSID